MGTVFRDLFWPFLPCVVVVVVAATCAWLSPPRGETIDVRVGTVVIEDAGVPP